MLWAKLLTNSSQTHILFNAVYYGPEAEGRKLIQPFIDNGPVVQNISTIPWSKVIDVSLFGLWGNRKCIKGNHIDSYSVGIKTLDLQSAYDHFDNFTALYDQYPNARKSTWFIEGLATRAVQAEPKGSTAFPDSHRAFTNHLYVLPRGRT